MSVVPLRRLLDRLVAPATLKRSLVWFGRHGLRSAAHRMIVRPDLVHE